MYRKDLLKPEAAIGVVRSTMHGRHTSM